MEQLLLHLWGDYIIQSDWMANNKKKLTVTGELACQLHCITYTLPFLLLTTNILAIVLIYLTHYIMDRTKVLNLFMNSKWKGNFGKAPFAPWSIFLIDNIYHITCNFLILKYIR